MNKHIVIFSHGFGVRSDSRGMFTDIADALSPGTERVLFDYNQWDEASRTLTVGTMDEWVEKLKGVVAETRTKNPGAIIDLICHSQGCIVAGLAKPEGLRKIVLLAPPATLTPECMQKFFAQFPNAHINFDELSVLHRRDGSITQVPPEYWQSIRNLEPVALYNNLAKSAKVVAIHAGADEVLSILSEPDFSGLDPFIKQTTVEGADHNFKDAARQPLVKYVHKEMERIPIVNEQDEITTHKFRDEVTPDDIYRVSALWVTNSNGDILLAQRGFHKAHNAGKWGPAVAGTVEEGETYESSIVKEAAEEIGLHGIQPGHGVKRRASDPYKYFSTTFAVVVDKPADEFQIEYPDVNQVRWFTREELERELKDHPENYLPGVNWALKEL